MKNSIQKLIAAFIACSAVTVAAGIVNADKPAGAKANSAELNGQTNAAVLARDTSNLRCWQYGELLFEQTHLEEKKLPGTESMLVFTSSAKGSDREVYLINNGSTTCLYEKI